MISMGIGLITAIFFYIMTKEYDDQEVHDAVVLWRQGIRDESEQDIVATASNCQSKYFYQTNCSITNPVEPEPESGETIPLLLPVKRDRTPRFCTTRLNPGLSHMKIFNWIKSPQFFMVSIIIIRITITNFK
jgi:hypothetical protein